MTALTSVVVTSSETASEQFLEMVQIYAKHNKVSPGWALTAPSHRAILLPWIESQNMVLPTFALENFKSNFDAPVWQPNIPRPELTFNDLEGGLDKITVTGVSPVTVMDVPSGVLDFQQMDLIHADDWLGSTFAIPTSIPVATGRFSGKGLTQQTIAIDPEKIAREMQLSLEEFMVQTHAGQPVKVGLGAVYAVPLLAKIVVRTGQFRSSAYTHHTSGAASVEVEVINYDPMLIRLDVNQLRARMIAGVGKMPLDMLEAITTMNNVAKAASYASIKAMAKSVSAMAMVEYLDHLLTERKKSRLDMSVRESVKVLSESSKFLMGGVSMFLDSMFISSIGSGYYPLSIEEIIFIVSAMDAFFDGLDQTAHFAGKQNRLGDLMSQMRMDLG